MSKTYTRKPIKVEAIQWTGENFEEVVKFINSVEPISQVKKFNREDKALHYRFDHCVPYEMIKIKSFVMEDCQTRSVMVISEKRFEEEYKEEKPKLIRSHKSDQDRMTKAAKKYHARAFGVKEEVETNLNFN